MQSGSSGPSDLIQSVSRAFRVLEEVGSAPDGLNAKQVARRCGLTLSTTYHLLRTLCYEGYLSRRPPGVYLLGYEIAGRFRDLAQALRQPPQVRAVLSHLSLATGHSTYYSRIVDGRVVITGVVEAPRSPHLEDLVVGFSEAAHATALGKALLSTMPPDRRRAYLREQGVRAWTPRTVTQIDELDAELRIAAGSQLFVEEGQFRNEVSCAAVLVRDPAATGSVGAIAFSANSSRFLALRDRLARELRLAAADLEKLEASRAPERSC